MPVETDITRTNRETGTRVLYYRDEKEGVVMVCLGLPDEPGVGEHGAARRVAMITEGQLQTRTPSLWCDGCSRIVRGSAART
jgi:hypothetical protein